MARPAAACGDPDAGSSAARRLGVSAEACYQAGLHGALCDEETRAALRQVGEAWDWTDAT